MNEAITIFHLYSSQSIQKEVFSFLKESELLINLWQTDHLQEFIQHIDKDSPALLICDADHKKADIYTLLQQVLQKKKDIPVIVIGKNTAAEFTTTIFEAGAKDYVDKDRLWLLPFIVKRELQRPEKELLQKQKEANNLLNAIIESSLNEIFLLNPVSNKFTFANQVFLDNKSYNLDDIKNLTFQDTIADHHKNVIAEMTEPFWKRDIRKMTFQKDSLSKDGSYYPVQVKLEYIPFGEEPIVLGISFDISHRKRDADLLNKQKQITRKLRLSNKHKSEFFANLSHEMRTTLNSVQLLSQILKENRSNNLQQEQLEYAHTIHNSTNSLLAFLNQVLDRSKIESGRMSFNLEYLEVDNFCKELERLFQLVAREKGVSFKFINNLNEEDISFLTDRIRLEQVLKNLISNALKFTKKGHVHLKVYRPSGELLATHEGLSPDNTLAFDVIDTGIGISSAKLNKIFENYMQADGTETESIYGGTGLGLYISKEIVQKMGGFLHVESELGKGSIFTLLMPTDSSSAVQKYILENRAVTEIHNPEDFKNDTISIAAQEPDKRKKPSPKKVKGTVLLIDDSETHNRALKDFLDFKIEKCVTAESAKQAFELLNTTAIDAIILDMYLPDADGKDVLHKMKQNKKFHHIPVIIYSGKSLSEREEEELLQKADAVIQKNVMSYKILVEKISKLLTTKKYHGQKS